VYNKDEEVVLPFLHRVSTECIHVHAYLPTCSFLCKEQHIDWRDLRGLETRLQFEHMFTVHTDQRLHSSLMHDGFAMELTNTWTTRSCIQMKIHINTQGTSQAFLLKRTQI